MTPTHTMTPMEVQPSLRDSGKNSDCSVESIIAAADWMEEQKNATGMSATEIATAEDAKSRSGAEPKSVKSPTTSPMKKKRKKSAYQCFCSATIATMREKEPEHLAQLEESKRLWKYLGAKWQRAKLDKLLFEKYTEQANHINNQESVGQGEQVGTEESKGESEGDGQAWMHPGTLENQWLRTELGESFDESPEGHVEVEKVLAHWRQTPGVLRYLIKFVGTKEPEWVDEEHCACDELIKAYWEQNGKGKAKKAKGKPKGKERAPKVVEDETPEDHVEVEKVLAHWEHVGRGLRYLIKFVGTKEPEWVDEEHCACDELISEYWSRRNSRTSELYNY